MADLIKCNKFDVILFPKTKQIEISKNFKDWSWSEKLTAFYTNVIQNSPLADQSLNFLDISICLVLWNKMTPNLLHLIKLANNYQ